MLSASHPCGLDTPENWGFLVLGLWVAQKCPCTARKGRFPGLWEGVTWNCALNRKRPLKSAPMASDGHPLKIRGIFGWIVCSIFSIVWGFGPSGGWFVVAGVVVSAENPAEKPSSGVFPDFSRGQVLWDGWRILNGLERR